MISDLLHKSQDLFIVQVINIITLLILCCVLIREVIGSGSKATSFYISQDEYNDSHGGKWTVDNLRLYLESTRGKEVRIHDCEL